MKQLVQDLFKGPGNNGWDLGRVLGAKAVLIFTGSFAYSVFEKGATIDWSNAGIGFAAVLAGAGAFIGIKDTAAAKATAPKP